MKENKEKIISDAFLLISEHEKHAKKMWIYSFVTIMAGIIFIAIYIYGQIKANETMELSRVAYESTYNTEVGRLIGEIVDTKINYLRAEISYRYNIFGIFGGMIFWVGVGSILHRKQKIKQLHIIKGVVCLIEKNS